jgi:dihydrofolate synthase/folylpolyglutamate synthase
MSVITRIGLEHTQYLGNTIEAIAGEKAGIIKAGRPVVCGAMPTEAKDVIRAKAAMLAAPVVDAMERATVRRVSQDLEGQKLSIAGTGADYGMVTLGLLGRHQIENCVTVVAAVEALADYSPIRLSEETFKKGLAAAGWPGRLQVLARDPPVLLDGAHNPDGAKALAVALKELKKQRKVGLIWGMCDDKDALAFARALGGQIHRCWTVPIATERSQSTRRLARIAEAEGWQARESLLDMAMVEAVEWAKREGGMVCIAGSLFLAGEVLERGAFGAEYRP